MADPKDTICAYPWNAAAIRPNGQVIPCCRYANDYPGHEDAMVDLPDPRNSKHWVELRTKMLTGEKIEYCDKCYKEEDSGLESMRQVSLRRFIPIENKIEPLTQLEISFNNLCNLACVHCSSYFSSTWYNEDFKKGKIGKIGVLKHNVSFEDWDLSQLKDLKIIGGEPFMQQEKFIQVMSRLNLSKMLLQICTNGTHMPNEQLKYYIEQCQIVSLEVSLDGIYEINDWYRWPSKFDEIIKNMQIYQEWFQKKENIRKVIHCVINAVNVMYLTDFINFMKKNFPEWDITWDWIQGPVWQQVCVLPPSIKEKLKQEFIQADKNYDNKIPNPYKVTIDRLNDTPKVSWKEFKRLTLELSADRRLDFLSMAPKFKSIWEEQ